MSLSSSLILRHSEVGIVVINIITDNVAIIVPYYRFCTFVTTDSSFVTYHFLQKCHTILIP